MKAIKVTYKELNEDLRIGILTSDFPLEDLVKDAIVSEDYNDTVNIVVQNDYDDCLIEVNIKDYLTPPEYSEVIKLNEGI